MQLPEEDERYLTEKGFDWALEPDGTGALLLLRNYPVDDTRFNCTSATIMVRIPPQYPLAALDMFYADPPIKLLSGAFPQAAEHHEAHGGRTWQRFSRHLTVPWRPNIDGLASFLSIVSRELRPRAVAA